MWCVANEMGRTLVQRLGDSSGEECAARAPWVWGALYQQRPLPILPQPPRDFHPPHFVCGKCRHTCRSRSWHCSSPSH